MTHVEKQLIARLNHLLHTAYHRVERSGQCPELIVRDHRDRNIKIACAQPLHAIIQQAHGAKKAPLRQVRGAHHAGDKKQKQPEHFGVKAAHMLAVVPYKKVRTAVGSRLEIVLMAEG